LKLVRIPADQASEAWPHIAPLLDPVIDRSEGHYTREGVRKIASNPDHRLWVVVNDAHGNRPMAAGITVPMGYPGGVLIEFIELLGGVHMADWFELKAAFEAKAREQHFDAVEMWARKGWAKHLPDYQIARVVLRKRLGDEAEPDTASNLKLIQIPAEVAGEAWPLAESLLAEAVEQSDGARTFRSLFDSITERTKQLWFMLDTSDGNRVIDACITSLLVSQGGVKSAMVDVFSSKTDQWERGKTDLEKWAHGEGCAYVDWLGSRSLAKRLPDYKVARFLMRKWLRHDSDTKPVTLN